MKQLVMSRKELQILTNCVHGSPTRYVHVLYPFYDLELFTLDIRKPELKKIVQFREFDSERTARMPVDRSTSKDELPTYSDFRNCLLTSGFLRYRNQDDIADTLADLGELVTGKKVGRENEEERTMSMNLGVAIEDMATSIRIFERAKSKGIGTWLSL